MVRKMGIQPMDHGFQFMKNWFLNRNLKTFREKIYPEFNGKPILYLELGVFEGMSLVWMFQHVLTHPDSKAVGVDPWLLTTKLGANTMNDVMLKAQHNLSPWISGKCILVRANSAEFLRKCLGRRPFHGIKANSVDLCMIDGNHHALAVLDDARFCCRIVKPGGWLLFDDVENDHEKSDHVKEGVEMWKKEMGNQIKFLWKHRYMEAYERVK